MNYNLPITKSGDTFDGITFNIEVNSVALDITNSVIIMQLRQKNELKKELRTGSGLTITNGVGGIFQINALIIDLLAGVYDYDIQIIFTDGTVKTYISGTWTITKDNVY